MSFRFLGCARRDGERVDRVVHQAAQRLVDHAMASDRRLAGEAGRDDRHAPMGAAAGAVAGVAAVLLALVDQLELEGLEARQPLADLGLDAQGLSST